MKPFSKEPSHGDLQALRSLFDAAKAAFDAARAAGEPMRWEGSSPVYPPDVARLMNHVTASAWCDPGYDPAATAGLFERIPDLRLAEIRSLLTAIARSERFVGGAWWTVLEQDRMPAILDRAEQLLGEETAGDLHAAKSPIGHPLAIAAMRLVRVWFVIALAPLALGLLVEYLRSHGYIARGNLPGPLYMLATLFALAGVFNLIVGWRGQRELAAIRRGDYLAHWSYGSGRAVFDDAVLDRDYKCRFLFFAPLAGLGLIGLGLGLAGAIAKENPHLLWQVGLSGVAAGLLLGLLLAVPAWFLIGIRVALARELPAEVVFTAAGFYRPGQFIPVASWARSQREIRLFQAPADGGARLEFKLWHLDLKIRQPYRLPRDVTAHFVLHVPPGREAEAAALAEHYRGR